MNMTELQHWRVERDAGGIAWVHFDRAGESTNALSASALAELSTLLDAFEREPPRAAIFRSAKAAGFIAGADIDEFSALTTFEGACGLVRRGWDLFNRLAAVAYPTLALVRGHCFGGGLELALACRYLVVVDDPSTRLALPEVMLGIFPGWGGMVRLPARVGPRAALDMMLTGKSIDARRARKMGLADALVPERLMEKSAVDIVSSGARRRSPSWVSRLFNGPLKVLVAHAARRELASKARREHYPAPYAIIEMWAKHGGDASRAPRLIEEIVGSPTARNLVRVYHLQERLKSFGKSSGTDTPPLKRVHVVGAGVMGGDIAAWCALCGLTTSLEDLDFARIAPAIARARGLAERRLRGDAMRLRDVMDRLIPDPLGHGAAHADVVIEAIVEDLDAKRQLFGRLEPVMRPDALLATNTSSLCLADLQAALRRPERLVGIHFFNPVAMMPLVEVVAGSGSDSRYVARACAFVRGIDKLPLPVGDAPGFLVNAVLAPYLLEAMRCVDEGIDPSRIDAAMRAFGMAMGPIELADTVGLDVALRAGERLADAGSSPPRCLRERVERGELGRKSGRGFYRWHEGKVADFRRENRGNATNDEALVGRLIEPLLQRTWQRVRQGVVADADLADAGIVFGAGFAPYTGGPLNYLRSRSH